jgi:murein DD-endopeptidase MepM/ murein hydrolase activator NlpD
VSVFVRQPDYTMEKLRVAPAMAKPDSAAQVRIDKEIARAREIGVRSQSTARLWQDPFLPPRDSRITSIFGTGREFNGKAVSRHLGTDYAGAVGDPVRATNRGVVAMVADFYLAGRVLYLDHGEGLVSAYFHLSSTAVAQGDTVERGQIIGAVGKSGRVTGPHLHWVVRYGTVTVDPVSMLELLGQ